MSTATTQTACIDGFTVIPVTVEADIRPGLPFFRIIGLPDRSVAEARERVRSALRNSGFKLPNAAVTINLTPATVHKRGSGIDLAIALAVLRAQAMLPSGEEWVLGELGLDGQIHSIPQLLPLLASAKDVGAKCILSTDSASGGAAEGLAVAHAPSLRELCQVLQGQTDFQVIPNRPRYIPKEINHFEIDQIIGQLQAKRALEVTLAGGHNLFLTGPPGFGKTALATAAIELLPSPAQSVLQELQVRHDLLVPSQSFQPDLLPLRVPHHLISPTQLIHEFLLAHQGILFLDEFPLFSRQSREVLRVPLQELEVQLGQGENISKFPAYPIVIAAQNSCLCGLLGSGLGECRCSSAEKLHYARRISQPLYDRFDIFCEMLPQSDDKASSQMTGVQMKKRIELARETQRKRYGSPITNAVALAKQKILPEISKKDTTTLQYIAEKQGISLRGQKRLLMVAQTIADLEGVDISINHIYEAVQYRKRPAIL